MLLGFIAEPFCWLLSCAAKPGRSGELRGIRSIKGALPAPLRSGDAFNSSVPGTKGPKLGSSLQDTQPGRAAPSGAVPEGGRRGEPSPLTNPPFFVVCSPASPRRCLQRDGLNMKRCCEGVGLPCLFKVSAIATHRTRPERGRPLPSRGQGAGVGSPSCKPLAREQPGGERVLLGPWWLRPRGAGGCRGGPGWARQLCTVVAEGACLGFRAGQEPALSYPGLLRSLRSPTQRESAPRGWSKNQPAKCFPLSGRARLVLAARGTQDPSQRWDRRGWGVNTHTAPPPRTLPAQNTPRRVLSPRPWGGRVRWQLGTVTALTAGTGLAVTKRSHYRQDKRLRAGAEVCQRGISPRKPSWAKKLPWGQGSQGALLCRAGGLGLLWLPPSLCQGRSKVP